MAALAPIRHFFGAHDTPQLNFDTLVDEKHVEVRRYQTYSVAKLRVQSDEDDQNRETAQMRLLSYLLGKNSRHEHIAAVAPFFQEELSVHSSSLLQLAGQDDSLKAFQISAVLPSHVRPDNAPLPLDLDVRIERVAPHLTAVLKFSGFTGTKKRERLTKYLSLWLRARGFAAVSPPRLAKFDPPFTLPFFRRNEIHIDVIKKY